MTGEKMELSSRSDCMAPARLAHPGRQFRQTLTAIGAIVAELAGGSPPLAFVIFGIGALLRFRTVLDNPKLTGKAIMVVVIGLACGMGPWVMAVFVTAFGWILLYALESQLSCRIRIRVGKGADLNSALGMLQPVLAARGCRI